MLLVRNKRKMTKTKKTRKGQLSGKQSASPVVQESSALESSLDSDFNSSEFELIEKKTFKKKSKLKSRQCVVFEGSPISRIGHDSIETNAKQTKKGNKIGIKKNKLQNQALKLDREGAITLSTTKKMKKKKEKESLEPVFSKASPVKSASSEIFHEMNLETGNTKKNGKALRNDSKTMKKTVFKHEVLPNSTEAPDVTRVVSLQKVDKRKKIADIFEEAELCMEEAIPKKMEKVKKLLMKGAKSIDRKEKSATKRKREHKDLSFKKSRVEVDTALLETDGISSGLIGLQKVSNKTDIGVLSQDAKVSTQSTTKLPDIDPNKFIPVKTQKLRTVVPEYEEGGESESDEEEQRMNLMEAFADDDIADEFMKEKEEAEELSKPKTLDLRLPGWGSWGGIGLEPKNNRRNRVVKFPGFARKDKNKKLVIINDDLPISFRKQQVDDLPPEFPSVAAFEASIRAPIGTTWVPQLAHNALVAPPVVTKMGAIIQPLDKSHLLNEAREEARKKMNDSIKSGKPAGQRQVGKSKEVVDHRKSQSRRKENNLKRDKK